MPADTTHFAITALRDMASQSPTFQAELGVASAAAALPFIYTKDKDRGKSRPLAVVFIEDGEFQHKQVAGGAQNWLLAGGMVHLYIARDTPVNLYDDEIQADIDAELFFSNMHSDILELAGVDDHLNITGSERAVFTETDQQYWNSLGRFYFAVYAYELNGGT